MRPGTALACAALLTWPVGCSQPPGDAGIRMMGHVRALASDQMRGRRATTADEGRALDYVTRELEAAGIAAPPSGRRHVFDVGSDKSANVYGLVPGSTGLSDEVVVVGAHVDHLGIRDGKLHAGAEDNASGVALVLEVGRAIAERRSELGRSVLLAFFGAEEIGKLGSLAYVTQPPMALERTVAMVNVDMIGLPLLDQAAMWIPKVLWGLPEDHAVGILGTEGQPGLRALVDQGCRASRLESVAPEDFPDFIKDLINAQARGRSDDARFRAAGIPSVFYGSGEADTYHSPDDIVDDIAPHLLERRATAVRETVILLSRADWAFVRAGER